MAWMFVVMITFSCVMFIHMELVDALLKVLDMLKNKSMVR